MEMCCVASLCILLASSAVTVFASNTLCAAEFRGPGVHHRFDDSPDDYEMDPDHRTRMLGGRSGQVILLRDGSEVLTDDADHENDADMFDQSSDEEKDLESQVRKGQGAREETPGPSNASESTSEEKAEQGTGPGKTVEEPKLKAATDGEARSS